MKIVANDYEPKEVFRMIREYTGLTQTELAKELNRKSYHGIKKIENGSNRFYFETLMAIAEINDLIYVSRNHFYVVDKIPDLTKYI